WPETRWRRRSRRSKRSYSDACRAARPPARLADQRREEALCDGVARDELFGMPLHADDEAVAVRQLDSLDDSVGGPGDLAEAAADREERHVVRERPVNEVELEGVAGWGDVVRGRVARLAEARGVDVAAAREDEALEPSPEGRERVPVEPRREQHGDPARRLD